MLRSSSFMFLLLLLTVEVQNTICISLITMFTTIWWNLNKIGCWKVGKILGLWEKNAVYYVNQFWNIIGAILKGVSASETIKWCYSIYHKTSILHHSKNYGSLTRETRSKVAINMEDLTCLLETVRTLKLELFLLGGAIDSLNKISVAI